MGLLLKCQPARVAAPVMIARRICGDVPRQRNIRDTASRRFIGGYGTYVELGISLRTLFQIHLLLPCWVTTNVFFLGIAAARDGAEGCTPGLKECSSCESRHCGRGLSSGGE